MKIDIRLSRGWPGSDSLSRRRCYLFVSLPFIIVLLLHLKRPKQELVLDEALHVRILGVCSYALYVSANRQQAKFWDLGNCRLACILAEPSPALCMIIDICARQQRQPRFTERHLGHLNGTRRLASCMTKTRTCLRAKTPNRRRG